MTDIELRKSLPDATPIAKGTDIISDAGKTSPLTELGSSSPYNLETPTHNNTTVSSQEKRSKSIASDESSDLSDLDSEAETEKMYDDEESQLLKLSTTEPEDETIHHEDDTMDQTIDDTLIRAELSSEIKEDKDGQLKTVSEELSATVAVLHQEQKEEPGADSVHAALTNGKRRIVEEDQASDDSVKRRKIDEDVPFVEAGVEAPAENESEEDAEDEEEEELTGEQKEQRLKDEQEELERQKLRKEAIQFLTEIEIDFAKLRDRLYEDKMSRFKSELEMCLNGSHPELQSVYSKIDAHKEEKIRLATLSQKYELECIDRKTRGRRTSVHQQYYKRTSDYRTKYLQTVMQDWDNINKERRNMDLEDCPEYQYKIPEYVDDLVHQRAQYNKEISVLVGLNDYYGFPTAPRLAPLQREDLDSDLRAMNLI